MKFNELAHYFTAIEQTSSRLSITQELAALFKKATPQEVSIIANLTLGQLNPPYIGTQFNIATTTMTDIVANVLGISSDAVKKEVQKLGDLGSVLAADYNNDPSVQMTITQVHAQLTDLENMSGTGSQDIRAAHVQQLLEKLDSVSAKYVVRIILGKLRLGFSDMTLIDALSWMEAGDKSLRSILENAYNLCADIGLIAQTLKQDGIAAIEDMHINVGIPIRPAAAERLPTAKAIVEKIGHCVAQPKLDGFRLQIHLDKTGKKPLIRFFSRNLLDMSNMFPDLVHAVEQLDAQELICEGEAIVFDRNTGLFLPFQETVKRKRKHGIEQAIEDFPLQVFVFDLLYLDGKEYLTATHAQRRKVLLQLFNNQKNDVVQVIEEKAIATPKELEDYFAANIASGLEGLVVKREDSIYQPGKRNFNWIKLKRQEEGHLEDTLDCVILGYYAGEGRRAQFGVGAFLVGLYNPEQDRFETVAKIGTGLKDPDWIDLKQRCDALAVKEKPKNVVAHKDLYPDVWVIPEMVVLIRADEITLSPVHAAGKTAEALGYALRFPRFMGYRPDKTALEATTVAEIKGLYKDQFLG